MEYRIPKLIKISNYNQKPEYKLNNLTKLFMILIIIYILIIILLIIQIFYSKLLLNKYEKKLKKIDSNKNYILTNKLIEDIQFYKEGLQLYIENKTKFYIKAREKTMKDDGKYYNDSSIRTIQDKLNWLLIHENPVNKTNIVDKILLHEYSIKKLGKDICVPIIKIYNNSEEINFKELPEKFVLKCNHGSGMNIICNNKSNLNITETKNKLDSWMKINFGLHGFEYHEYL